MRGEALGEKPVGERERVSSVFPVRWGVASRRSREGKGDAARSDLRMWPGLDELTVWGRPIAGHLDVGKTLCCFPDGVTSRHRPGRSRPERRACRRSCSVSFALRSRGRAEAHLGVGEDGPARRAGSLQHGLKGLARVRGLQAEERL